MPRLIAPFLIILALGLPGGIAAQDAMQAAKVAADFVGAAPVEPLPDPIPAGIEAIRAPALAAHIAFLAAPSMEGRGLGGRGLGAAIEYAAAGLALAGIAPLDQSGQASAPGIAYFQEVPLREIGDFTGQITIERRRGGEIIRRTFSSCVDCLFSETSNQSISAPVVFAGYGHSPRISPPVEAHKITSAEYKGRFPFSVSKACSSTAATGKGTSYANTVLDNYRSIDISFKIHTRFGTCRI